MKKLFLSFAVLAGLAVVSCGNKAENTENAEAADTTEVVAAEEVAVDTTATDSATVVAAEEVVETPAAE